jgi:hypothetical protein
VPAFEFSDRLLLRVGVALFVALISILLRYKPRILLVLTVGVIWLALACLLTSLALLDRVTLPLNFWTEPQPGGLAGLLIGGAIGLGFFCYLVSGEPMRRAQQIASFWEQAGVKIAVIAIGLMTEVILLLGGAIVGSLLVMEWRLQ